MSDPVIIGRATLYLGDCRDVLPSLPRVDAVVTDPPFNAGKDFANDSMGAEEWRAFCDSVADAVATVTPENILVEVGKNDTAMRAAFDARFRYRWAIALNYTNAMRNGAVGYANFGLVLWYGEKCHKRFMDRIDAPLTSTIDEFSHPSPKEVAHYRRLVDMFTPDNGTVLDPFVGSGTTGIAAVLSARNFIGCEVDPKHFATACRRIEDAQRQGDFFVDAA